MDMLGDILSKQKNIAKDMCQEITIQNEIIDDIHDIIDNADQRLIRNIRNTERISKKSGKILIINLFILISYLLFSFLIILFRHLWYVVIIIFKIANFLIEN